MTPDFSLNVNDLINRHVLTVVLPFTPCYHGWWEHSVFHAATGRLEHRGLGDIFVSSRTQSLHVLRRCPARDLPGLQRIPSVMVTGAWVEKQGTMDPAAHLPFDRLQPASLS